MSNWMISKAKGSGAPIGRYFRRWWKTVVLTATLVSSSAAMASRASTGPAFEVTAAYLVGAQATGSVSIQCLKCKPPVDILRLGKPRRLRGAAISKLIAGKNLELISGLGQPAIMQIQHFGVDGAWEKTEFQIVFAVKRGMWKIEQGELYVTHSSGSKEKSKVWVYPSRRDIVLLEVFDEVDMKKIVLVFKIVPQILN